MHKKHTRKVYGTILYIHVLVAAVSCFDVHFGGRRDGDGGGGGGGVVVVGGGGGKRSGSTLTKQRSNL